MATALDETFEAGLARLRLEGLEGGGEKSPLPDRLEVSKITLAPAVFQGRDDVRADGSTDGGHVAALVRALSAKSHSSQFLDPVTVYRVGTKTYLVDGHHRLAAYRAAEITHRVPVRWFEGSLEGAVQESVGSNQKAKLPMRPNERLEAAWRLTQMGVLSKRRVAEASGVSERAVAGMRVTLREYREAFPEEPVGDLWATRRALNGDETRKEWTDELNEEEIVAMVSGLRKLFGCRLRTKAQNFGEALLRLHGEEFFRDLATWQGYRNPNVLHDDDGNTDF